MEKITALITLYNPDRSVAAHVRNIRAQVTRVILWDNSTESHRDLFENMEGCIYLHRGRNFGIPGAYDRVLRNRRFHWDEREWILFFDQDSDIRDRHVQKLIAEYQNLEKRNFRVGCLGPVFYNKSNHRVEVPRLKTRISAHSYRVKNIITSSLLTRYYNLEAVGFWNDRLFLDLSDWDLCWRMERAGMLCVITSCSVLQHSVGSAEKRVGPIHLRVGQPMREYYQTRDALYLLEKNYVPLKMRFRLSANITVRPVVHLLFLDHRLARLHYIARGFRDYRTGIRGEYIP